MRKIFNIVGIGIIVILMTGCFGGSNNQNNSGVNPNCDNVTICNCNDQECLCEYLDLNSYTVETISCPLDVEAGIKRFE